MVMGICKGRNHKYRVYGFSWTVHDNSWKHYMIRGCVECGERICDDVYWINTDVPVCSACLSQELDVLITDQGTTPQCMKCHTVGKNIIYLDPAVRPNVIHDSPEEEDNIFGVDDENDDADDDDNPELGIG